MLPTTRFLPTPVLVLLLLEEHHRLVAGVVHLLLELARPPCRPSAPGPRPAPARPTAQSSHAPPFLMITHGRPIVSALTRRTQYRIPLALANLTRIARSFPMLRAPFSRSSAAIGGLCLLLANPHQLRRCESRAGTARLAGRHRPRAHRRNQGAVRDHEEPGVPVRPDRRAADRLREHGEGEQVDRGEDEGVRAGKRAAGAVGDSLRLGARQGRA